MSVLRSAALPVWLSSACEFAVQLVLSFAAVYSPAGRQPEDAEGAADERLVGRIAKGDGDALAELYDRQIRLVFSLACRIVERPTEAEEIAQDVFTYVWKKAADFDRRRGTVTAWLLVMTRSRSLDPLRSRGARPDAFQPGTAHLLAQVPGNAEDQERRLLAAADIERLRTALSALPQGEREPIELAYYGGLSQTEIAERLRQPLGTVKTRVRNGLLRLRSALDGMSS